MGTIKCIRHPCTILERIIMLASQLLSKATILAAVCAASVSAITVARAQSATEIQLSYKDKKFDPAESSDAVINVRAQKAGRYEFFDEYNEKTARGALVVK